MEEEQCKRIYSRLSHLMGQSVADHTLVSIALGLIAVGTDDWRGVVDNVRLMAVSNIENLTWDGSPEEKLEILTEGRRVVKDVLDNLYAGLLAREQEQGKSPI
jgi:hypothetical protein